MEHYMHRHLFANSSASFEIMCGLKFTIFLVKRQKAADLSRQPFLIVYSENRLIAFEHIA